MTNGPVNGYTVDELVGAYGTMKSLLQAPGFSQDEPARCGDPSS